MSKLAHFSSIPIDIIQDTILSLKNKKIFLTGGTGFFGKSTLSVLKRLDQIEALNLEITILTRNPESFKSNYSDLCALQGLQFLKGDILDFSFPDSKFDTILHYATPANATLNLQSPLDMFNIVTLGTRRILDFAVHCNAKSFLLASSGAVYGPQPPEIKNIDERYFGAPPTHVLSSAYGEGKRASELMGNLYSQKFGFEHKIARCFAFVGPYLDPHGTFAIGNFLWDAIQNKSIHIAGDGTPYRSYLYSDDLVFWLFRLLSKGRNHIPYNIGSDQEINIKDLAFKIQSVVNPQLNVDLARVPDPKLTPTRYVPCIQQAKVELGLDVWTPLEEGVMKTADAYRRLTTVRFDA